MSSAVHAAELVTFEQGGTAKASEVNGNFEALNSEVQANKAAISNIALTPGPAGPAGSAGSVGPAGPAGPAGSAGSGATATETIAVDCATDSLQTAIETAVAGIVTINVTGTCNENITIARSNIIIEGGGAGVIQAVEADPQLPGLSIIGASNIILNDLTVNGGAFQALALDDAQASLTNTDVTSSNQSFFVAVVDHSKLRMNGSAVDHANAQEEGGALLVYNNSTLILDGGNTISTDGFEGDALAVVQSSVVTKGLSAQGGDSITSTGTEGISLILEGASSAFFITDTESPSDGTLNVASGTTITGALEAIGGSYILADALTLTGALYLELNSSMLAEGYCDPSGSGCSVSLNGDINLFKGGKVTLESSSVTAGTITVSRKSEIFLDNSIVAASFSGTGLIGTDGGSLSGNINCSFGDISSSYDLSAFIGGSTDTTSLTVSGGSAGAQSCVLKFGVGNLNYPL